MTMQSATITTIDGKQATIKIGDWVGFKSDHEQSGQITKIEPADRYSSGYWLTLENPDGFGGDYLRYAKITREHSSAIWTD